MPKSKYFLCIDNKCEIERLLVSDSLEELSRIAARVKIRMESEYQVGKMWIEDGQGYFFPILGFASEEIESMGLVESSPSVTNHLSY